jgi:hypothetical protein
VVGTDLEGLVTAHENTLLAGFLVLENLDGAGAPFLPLVAVI